MTRSGPSTGRGHGNPLNLVDRSQFHLMLAVETLKATRLQYCLSLLCLTPDVSHADARLMRWFARTACGAVRGFDVGTQLVPTCFSLLLIDAEPGDMRGIVDRLVDAIDTCPRSISNPVSPFTLSVGASSYPKTVGNDADLLAQALGLMRKAWQDGGNRLYLPNGSSRSAKGQTPPSA